MEASVARPFALIIIIVNQLLQKKSSAAKLASAYLLMFT
jgi:hypothetical protein